jgi:type II secretory pathway pseudopilin PulG
MEHRSESGASLVEMMIALALFSVVIVAVDSSLTVVQKQQVQVTNATAALNNLQIAQEAISTDIHAAVAWTTPAVPTVMPAQPVTATTLSFTASLNNSTTGTINIALNTSTHVLTVTCSGSAAACPGSGSGTELQAQVQNIDSASLFTMTTKEVSTTQGAVTTNAFYYTDVASSLILDSPRVGAPHVSKTIVSSPSLEVYNVEYACQLALSGDGASGSC